MKRTMIILIGLMLSMIASAQPNFLICRTSEAEIDGHYLKNPNGSITTSETYSKLFIEKYGVEKYHFVINAIGDGTIGKEIQILKDKGLNELADDVRTFQYLDEIKTCFVENGKFYVLTYKPDKNSFASSLTRGVYLYRRDDDSMRIASDLIRNDIRVDGEYQRELRINFNKGESIYKIADTTNAVLKETPAIVLIATNDKWKDGSFTYTNTVILLIPDGNLGYHSACYESDSKFAVNKIESTSTNGNLIIKYQSGTVEFKIDGNDIVVGGTIKLKRD